MSKTYMAKKADFDAHVLYKAKTAEGVHGIRYYEGKIQIYDAENEGWIDANAATATILKIARTIRTNLSSTSTASFDGSANITPGVTGTLELANGGTGGSSARAAINNLVKNCGADKQSRIRNCLWGGKFLGNSVSASQQEEIKNGTFDDMFIGDYWNINYRVHRIGEFNPYLGKGDTECTTNHIKMVTDLPLYNAKMNDTDIVTGAYIGSKMYTNYLNDARNTIKGDFGSSHIMTHRLFLANAVVDNYESGRAWYDCQVELMTEADVYGGNIFHNFMQGTNFSWNHEVDNHQLPLFAMAPELISNGRQWYWLRDVALSSSFAGVDGSGGASCYAASLSIGVRPAFCICYP